MPLLRELRLHNFLEFLGPGGLCHTRRPVEMLELCQRGYATARVVDWNDISRGMLTRTTADQADELQMRTFWRRWKELMSAEERALA